jgi:hypothetical protein
MNTSTIGRKGLSPFIALALTVLASCPNPVVPEGGGGSPSFPELPANPIPVTGGDLVYAEDCEGALGAEWTVYGNPSAAPEQESQLAWSGTSSYRFDSYYLSMANTQAGMSLSATLPGDANVRFRVKTDVGGEAVQTWFLFLVDGVEVGRYSGLDADWLTVDYLVAAAPGSSHTFDFRLYKNSNSYYPSRTNSVWLDDVTLCLDSVYAVDMEPDGPKKAILGQADLPFSAFAVRKDGSRKADAAISYSVVEGTGSIDGSGAFTPGAPGLARIRASSGAASADSGDIEVAGSAFVREPFSYGGQSFAGLGAISDPASPVASADANIVIGYPSARGFSADGFFGLEGSVTYSGAWQYAYVVVQKGDSSDRFFVRGAPFATRVWLRYGPGEYVVSVYRAEQTQTNLDYEGDFRAWSYSGPVYRFYVTNTRPETGVFRYPSAYLQADDVALWNLAQDLAYGLGHDYWKLKAMHDYVVKYLHYDSDSLVVGCRKKQDAITVFVNRMGVCEGYTSLFGALARAAGLSAKAACGDAGGGHAWNLVNYQGFELMIDTTWDDPWSEPDSPNVRWTYFLCAADGSAGDHVWEDDRPSRSIGGGVFLGN